MAISSQGVTYHDGTLLTVNFYVQPWVLAADQPGALAWRVVTEAFTDWSKAGTLTSVTDSFQRNPQEVAMRHVR